MKQVNIDNSTKRFIFRWVTNSDGDLELEYKDDRCNEDCCDWEYWGEICPHHKSIYRITWDGKAATDIVNGTLKEAKERAEYLCVVWNMYIYAFQQNISNISTVAEDPRCVYHDKPYQDGEEYQ